MPFRNPIIFGNYMRHIRSYAFLITMAISIYAAFAFVPTPDASYDTMRFGKYIAAYTPVWVSHVSAIMLSIFLSIGGFFLIQGSLKKDEDLGIGQLIGATPIHNIRYLFSKVWSNFLLLLTILSIGIVMSAMLAIVHSDESTLAVHSFMMPYLLITVPSLFCIAVLAVILEVFFYGQRIVQYLLFCVLFFGALLYTPKEESSLFTTDVLGIHYVTTRMEEQVQHQMPDTDTNLSIGFIAATAKQSTTFSFATIPFSIPYIGSRILCILLFCSILAGVSLFFHRFSIPSTPITQEEIPEKETTEENAQFGQSFIQHRATSIGGLLSLIQMELKVLYKQNSYGQHLLLIAGFIFMFRTSIEIAHSYIVPLVWGLQLTKWSRLVTKEYNCNSHYFTATAYQPIRRVFMAKILAGIIIAIGLALPILIRYGIAMQPEAMLNIIFGGILMVSCAIVLGTFTKSGKLFEVLFIVVLYANLNQTAFLDYFGAIHSTLSYTMMLWSLSIVLLALAIYRKTFDYE